MKAHPPEKSMYPKGGALEGRRSHLRCRGRLELSICNNKTVLLLLRGVARIPTPRLPPRGAAWRVARREVLDAAYAAGVRYFDCARSYGRSEEFLASWLEARKLCGEDLAVGSKWGYRYTAEWRVDNGAEPHEVKDHSLAHFLSQKPETWEYLGDHLRLYQIHSATLASGVLEDAAVLAALGELRATGVRIGLSVSGAEQGEVLGRALRTGAFDCVQATWNLLEQSAGPALEEAARGGMRVILKEAMANGRCLRHPALLREAERLVVPPDALALAAAMAQAFRPMVLSGVVTTPQLESNLKALEPGPERGAVRDSVSVSILRSLYLSLLPLSLSSPPTPTPPSLSLSFFRYLLHLYLSLTLDGHLKGQDCTDTRMMFRYRHHGYM